MVVDSYFDLWNVLVNEVSGSQLIFLALSTICIVAFCAKFRMPNMIILLIVTTWFLFLSPFIGFALIPTVLLASIFIGYMFYKIIKG